MAIQFTNARSFSTDVGRRIFQNVPVASQWFKILITSVGGATIPDQTGFLGKVIFDFAHSFHFYNSGPTLNTRFSCTDSLGNTVATDVPLTIGVVYGIALTWNGNTGKQRVWANGVPKLFGGLTGNTQNNSSALTFGISPTVARIVFALDDHNIWDNYELTGTDITALLSGADPITIGTGATWRGRWTLSGSTGATATIGDAGLKNAYGGGGSLGSGGDGSDCIAAAGAGLAVYAPALIWAPTVTAHPYVAGCGKIIAATLTSNIDGSPQAPSQLLTAPTLTVNGTSLGALTNPWLTGVHQCVFYSTPSNYQINPGDVVSLTAPPAWCNTAAGSVGPLSGTIDNRSGGSSIQVESLTKTIRMGINNSQTASLEYFPFKNAKFLNGLLGYFGKLPPGTYGLTGSPGEAGMCLFVWDATKPLTPVIFSGATQTPGTVNVTHLSQYDVSPSDGIGYVRVYDFEPVNGSAWQTTPNGFSMGYTQTDPAYTGTPNYDNLFIYLPSEWSLVNGVPVFDRSDPHALSSVYMDRVSQNVGSMRAVDSTACGGACNTYPYPELLAPANIEWFWGNSRVGPQIGFTSLEPVDVTATPWIYSAQFRQAGNQFTATLSDTISTTPAVGTNETWHFSDGATAPLMAGLEIQVDAEIVRILSGSGTAWTVYRGSNGTTPATHAPGTVAVFGRQPITSVVNTNGQAPFATPCLIRCNKPHGHTTLHGYSPFCVVDIVLADGYHANGFTLGLLYATGPDTFVSISGGYPNPAGAKPSRVYPLDPTTHLSLQTYPAGIPIDVYATMVGQFAQANIHINVPVDACDDMVYTYARTMLANFPAGRKIYIEYANEPWNFSPPFTAFGYCTVMAGLAMPGALRTYSLAYYAYRCTQVRRIFHDVFDAAERGGELVMIANCQMGGGAAQATPHLNFGLAQGEPFEAIAGAPYYNMTAYPQSIAAFDLYDDDQACEMLLHDFTYDPTQLIAIIQSLYDAVTSYNTTNGKNCVLIGYEGGIDFPAPTGAHRHNERSHDIAYNPNFYHVEQGWFALLQKTGFDHLHVYSLGIGWPDGWGMYHMRTQKHSRGDGLNGAADNRLVSVNPDSPYYDDPGGTINQATVKQDLLNDSVRGQAFLDWNAAIDGTSSSGATGLRLAGDVVAADCRVDMLTAGLADLMLHDDRVAASSRAKKITRPDPFNATGK